MSKSKKAGNEHIWALDLDEICAFIFDGGVEGKMNSTIKETFESDKQTDKLRLKEKVVTENKGQNSVAEQKMRMELVMWLLDSLNNTYVATDSGGSVDEIESSTLAEKVVLNTLYQYGFLN